MVIELKIDDTVYRRVSKKIAYKNEDIIWSKLVSKPDVWETINDKEQIKQLDDIFKEHTEFKLSI